MIEQSVSLASNGVVKVPGYEQLVRFGYTKNRGVYRLAVTATGEWEGLAIRCFWHVPDGKDPASSLVQNGTMDVPASVTAQPGSGCITFEGSDGTKTVTSADLRYRVSANSGTEDGTEPEPGTPAWQQLVDAVHTDATAAEQAKTDAQTAAQQAGASAGAAATSAANAGQSAKQAADSLLALKDGIASGDFKGEPGTSPTVTVQDIAGGHRIVITDATGTSFVDVLNGKDATVDATLSQSGKAADAKVTGDALATKAVIDDTAVGTDAWSSKHIIDTLCPPLEETGNPVVCYPVENYPLGVKATWEPVQEGSGTPSPENIRPIKGRASVRVERCGKNLWSLGNVGFRQYKEISTNYPAGKYVLSYEIETESTDDNIQVGWFIDGKWKYFHKQKDKRIIIVMSASVGISGFRFYAGSSPTDQSNATYKNIQLEIGDSATTYTPYNGQTNTLTLPETVYGGTVDAVTGESSRTWRTITLTGEERAHIYSIFFYLDLSADSSFVIEKPADGKTGKSSHYPYAVYTNNCIGFTADGESLTYASNGKYPLSDEGLQEWKSYLSAQYAAGTPVQIAYKLATPTPFTATGAQPINALSGVNIVLTDADSATVTGRADPIKRIIDLEDAVASMT